LIGIPTLKEQKEIVAYIEEKKDEIDTAISKAEQEIKLTIYGEFDI
jgi:restriction endonuclease S subunit